MLLHRWDFEPPSRHSSPTGQHWNHFRMRRWYQSQTCVCGINCTFFFYSIDCTFLFFSVPFGLYEHSYITSHEATVSVPPLGYITIFSLVMSTTGWHHVQDKTITLSVTTEIWQLEMQHWCSLSSLWWWQIIWHSVCSVFPPTQLRTAPLHQSFSHTL